MKPTTELSEEEIRIFIMDLEIRITTKTGNVMIKEFGLWAPLEYRHIDQTSFMKKFTKKKNLKRPKASLFKRFLGKHVFAIDTSITDKRLFFLLWDCESYEKFRGKPIWKASFHFNKTKRTKEWYENDLSAPEKTWTTQPTEKNPQKKIQEFAR